MDNAVLNQGEIDRSAPGYRAACFTPPAGRPRLGTPMAGHGRSDCLASRVSSVRVANPMGSVGWIRSATSAGPTGSAGLVRSGAEWSRVGDAEQPSSGACRRSQSAIAWSCEPGECWPRAPPFG
jgi:hypothetical protein